MNKVAPLLLAWASLGLASAASAVPLSPTWSTVPSLPSIDTMPSATLTLNQSRALYKLLRTGRFDQALQRIDAALDRRPEDAGLYYLRGYAQAGLKRWKEAGRSLARAAGLRPKLFVAYKLLALVELQSGDREAAVRSLVQALSLHDSARLRRLLAAVYFEQGKDNDAVRQLAQSLHGAAETAAARAMLRRIVARKPRLFDGYRLLAVIALRDGDVNAAERHLRKALAIRGDAALQRLLGELYLREGRTDAGVRLLLRSLQQRGASPVALAAAKGLYEFRAGDLKASERALRSALRKDPGRADARLLLVVNLLHQRRFARAVREAGRAIALAPGRAPVLLNLQAQGYLGLQQPDDARRVLERALAEKPGLVVTRLNLSAVYVQRKQFPQAHEQLRQALKLDPKNFQAHVLTARLYQIEGRLDKAQRYLRTLTAANPGNPILLGELVLARNRAGNDEGAMRAAQDLIAAAPARLESYLLLADVEAAAGRPLNALSSIDDGMRQAGERSDALQLAAAVALSAGRANTALAYLQRLKNRGELRGRVLTMQYAQTLIAAGRFQQARRYARTDLSDTTLVDYVCGISWARQGRMHEAARCLRRAVRTPRPSAKALFALARVELALGRRAEGLAELKKAVDLAPDEDRYILALAAVYQQQQRPADAIATYLRGLGRRPHSVPLLNNVAMLYQQQGNWDRALSYAKRALEAAPEEANVLDTVGWLYVQSEQAGEGIPYLERAVRATPGYSLFRYHLGVGYYRAGRIDKARRQLQSALRDAPNAPWSEDTRELLARAR